VVTLHHGPKSHCDFCVGLGCIFGVLGYINQMQRFKSKRSESAAGRQEHYHKGDPKIATTTPLGVSVASCNTNTTRYTHHTTASHPQI
jgi:hypothetical protein